MSATHVLVVCIECAGTGNGPDVVFQCDVCLGQGHLNLPRAPHGGPPDGWTEWKIPTLPELPDAT